MAIAPGARTGARSHGELESVIDVVSGRARMRWGDRVEFTAEAGPGAFVFVPPHVPHQEENASATTPQDRDEPRRHGARRRSAPDCVGGDLGGPRPPPPLTQPR